MVNNYHSSMDVISRIISLKVEFGPRIAEARRRKFLELHPEEATNQEPVLFSGLGLHILTSLKLSCSMILVSRPICHDVGRAAMSGFFMAYLVDVLTGLDVVGQSGNFTCKIGLFMAVIGVVVFRQKESLKNLKNLAEEATFYDKQWQASWQDQDSAGSGALGDTMKLMIIDIAGPKQAGWPARNRTGLHSRIRGRTGVGKLSSLQTLELGSNSISGLIPDSICALPDSLGRLLALEELDISYNEINGTLPRSIGRLTKLQKLNIEHNLLTGTVTEDHFANLTSLVSLRGNANMLRIELMADNWEPPFQLGILTLNSWSLGPKFPYWLQNQTNLSVLYLGSTKISDNIPSWFWSTFSGLKYLNISDNNLSFVPLNDFLCSKMDIEQKQIIYMNMGNTNLSGVLPDCWTPWEFLNILNFQNNNLTGEIPKSLANLSSLESLNLNNNKLSGELPVNLLNSKSLQIVDLSSNKFIGGIATSIAGEATILKLLNLRSNKLTGKIPDEICRLDSMQILDLADNNLSGGIPNCFSNFSVMTGKVDPNQMVELAQEEFMGSAWLMIRGRVNGYGSILGLLTFLDLSSNDLHGVIPSEITQLVELRFLNFSSNRLTGRVPEKIGDMKVLELLDLSRNQLDGMIPLSMSKLSFLNGLNLSHNNLTGRIPSSTQLQSFQESSFVGNRLCGAPVSLRCERNGGGGAGDGGEEGGSGGSDGDLITSILVGLVVGFWVVVGPLVNLQNPHVTVEQYD
ncbi:hypothetical protein R6Q59_014293 [Mikania micrantha]